MESRALQTEEQHLRRRGARRPLKCYKEPQIVGDPCLCEKGLRRNQRSGTVAGNEPGEIGSDPSVQCPRNYTFLKCLG